MITALQMMIVTKMLKPSMPTAPPTVLNGPTPLGLVSVMPQISDHPCTRAQTGNEAMIAARATATV